MVVRSLTTGAVCTCGTGDVFGRGAKTVAWSWLHGGIPAPAIMHRPLSTPDLPLSLRDDRFLSTYQPPYPRPDRAEGLKRHRFSQLAHSRWHFHTGTGDFYGRNHTCNLRLQPFK